MLEIVLPRRFESISVACEALEAYAEAHSWAAADVARVGLAMGKAVGNAVEHGAGARVDIRYGIQQYTLTIRIQDKGRGPDPARIRDASLPASALATEGRGLYILSALADAVSIDDLGVLSLVFRPRS